MSILVRDMKMPNRCFECIFLTTYPNFFCLAGKRDLCAEHSINISRPDWCPLIEVKSPHGDLIDRDETIKAIGGRPHVGIGINDDDDEFDSGMSCQWWHDTGTIKDMPAIIKAKGSDT